MLMSEKSESGAKQNSLSCHRTIAVTFFPKGNSLGTATKLRLAWRKCFELRQCANSFVRCKNHGVSPNGNARSSGVGRGLQRLPGGEIPGGKCVAIKVPGFVCIRSGPNNRTDLAFNGLAQSAPIEIVKDPMLAG